MIKAAPAAPRGAVFFAAASARAGRAASGRSPHGARLLSQAASGSKQLMAGAAVARLAEVSNAIQPLSRANLSGDPEPRTGPSLRDHLRWPRTAPGPHSRWPLRRTVAK